MMSSKQSVQHFAWWSMLILSIGVSAYALVVYGLGGINAASVHPAMIATYAQHPIGIYAHIFAALIALAIGPFQLSARLRKRNINLHRWSGRIYLFVGVLPGGLAGLYMAQYAFGGLVSTFGFSLLSLVWLFTGFMAYQAIRKKDIASHRLWMIRNFSLTLAAVTIRVYIGLFFAAGYAFEDFYPMLTWLCWVPNILLVEWLINKRGSAGLVSHADN